MKRNSTEAAIQDENERDGSVKAPRLTASSRVPIDGHLIPNSAIPEQFRTRQPPNLPEEEDSEKDEGEISEDEDTKKAYQAEEKKRVIRTQLETIARALYPHATASDRFEAERVAVALGKKFFTGSYDPEKRLIRGPLRRKVQNGLGRYRQKFPRPKPPKRIHSSKGSSGRCGKSTKIVGHGKEEEENGTSEDKIENDQPKRVDETELEVEVEYEDEDEDDYYDFEADFFAAINESDEPDDYDSDDPNNWSEAE
ncbi:hypothetical protein BLS_003598 [Venturia inaequalis]|uniref:Uncharacterized protein n=1 Tax=Venturia inaequalis TaxID=5025 RepID=A0A8H3YTZ5_VENIN|nr:hypothetical protein BLS_003598 [Venturia inaequalis]KAE9973574.1 hypothetical protein EG328_004313 [Venturia inaequalis]